MDTRVVRARTDDLFRTGTRILMHGRRDVLNGLPAHKTQIACIERNVGPVRFAVVGKECRIRL